MARLGREGVDRIHLTRVGTSDECYKDGNERCGTEWVG